MMDNSENVRLHAIVEGRVQGVSFRYFVQSQAFNLGLTGWVRNRWNGTVEVVAEGARKEVEQLLSAIRRGPPAANVTQVKAEWESASGEFKSFKIRMTA